MKVSEVGRGDEVVDAARTAKPDVALLDVEMPGLDGIEAAAALRRAVPGVRVLMVTTFGRPGYLRRVADIARKLHLSEGTVRNHLSAAIGKTGARTRAEAARIALDNGWL